MPKTFDIRTYVTLEEALTRRLAKDWEKRSAPIYAAIAAACSARNWNKARVLVPDLDMTEVGTENREWIKYLLRATAVFGAGMVAKKEPSFMSVGSFDKTLNQVTSNFLMYLEYNASAQVQAQALQLIAEDEQKSTVQKKTHKYGNTQIDIDPYSDAAQSLKYAKYLFQSQDLMGEGVDETNHVTVRYGIEDEDVDDLRAFIAGLEPFEAQLDGVMLFEPSEHSEGATPVVARVVCPTLHFINKEIQNHAQFKPDSYGVYRPHATLAYCKPDVAAKYLDLHISGKFRVRAITISHKNGVTETIPFGIVRKGGPGSGRYPKGSKQILDDYAFPGAAWSVNRYLRSGELDAPTERMTQALDKEMSRDGSAETLHRVVDASLIRDVQVGETYTEKGYTSTTRDVSQLPQFEVGGRFYDSDQPRQRLEIQVPAGYPRIDTAQYAPSGMANKPVRGEVILARGSTFRVVKKTPQLVTVQVLEPDQKWDESQHPRGAGGKFSYAPVEGAAEAGGWDRTGDEPKWQQQHLQLVKNALQGWVGDTSWFKIHALDAIEGAPIPGSGSGKEGRAQAEALLWELDHHSIVNDVPLYRGSGEHVTGAVDVHFHRFDALIQDVVGEHKI